MNKIFTLFILCLITVTPLIHAKGFGESSGLTLLMPLSPKAAALGGSGGALKSQTFLINNNPASLYGIQKNEITTMYHKGFDDDSLTSVLIGKNLYSAVLAAAIIYYDTGQIEMYDSTGSKIKKIGQRDLIIMVGSAENFKGIDAGLTAKFISSEIFGENAYAFAVDLGLAYNPFKNFRTAFSIQNIGSKLIYVDYKENLPFLIKPAIAWDYIIPGRKITLTIDCPYYINEQIFSIAYGLQTSFENRLTLIAGKKHYFDNYKNDEDLNLGWTLSFKLIQLEHTITFTKNLSIPQSFALTFKF